MLLGLAVFVGLQLISFVRSSASDWLSGPGPRCLA
jgi:hypothetical protein